MASSPETVRLMSLVKTSGDKDGCWIWAGATVKGYGQVRWEGRTQRAHRVLWALLNGTIPEGFDLDHICERPLCVNPRHCQPVASTDHRAVGSARQTHCKNGHLWTEKSTYYRKNGEKVCRPCSAARQRARAQRKRDGL